MRIETEYGTYENVFLKFGRYLCDDSPAVQAWSMEEGPIATLTTCLDDRSLKKCEGYVDTNNCPWVVDFIRQNHLGKVTGKNRVSGYCTYPLIEFDIDEIMKHVPEEARKC